MAAKPKLAVFKFASCDGCQLSLLDCEDELLAVVGEVQVANFLEASREVVKGPYDLTLVEGSITTAHDAERIQQVRKQSRFLVTIGACATAGGIQALRNFKDVREFTSAVEEDTRRDIHRQARGLQARCIQRLHEGGRFLHDKAVYVGDQPGLFSEWHTGIR